MTRKSFLSLCSLALAIDITIVWAVLTFIK